MNECILQLFLHPQIFRKRLIHCRTAALLEHSDLLVVFLSYTIMDISQKPALQNRYQLHQRIHQHRFCLFSTVRLNPDMPYNRGYCGWYLPESIEKSEFEAKGE